MRIKTLRISGYRRLKEVEIDLGDYTAFIGANGTGKSSVLYALDWFFNGGELTEADLHMSAARDDSPEELAEGADIKRVEVEVTFDQINDGDRRELGKYARGEVVRLRRSWPVEGKSKMVGHSMQGPGFSAIRGLTRVTEIRSEYARMRSELSELPEVTAKEDILNALAEWEDRPENRDRLESVEDVDLTHLYGIAGDEVLARRFKFILVPASIDIAAAVGTAGKGSVLSRLVGAFTAEAVSAAKRDWETRHETQLAELEETMREHLDVATEAHSTAVTRHFADLVATGTVRFVGEPPEWSLRGEGTVRAEVRVNGLPTDVGHQGHGVQRALMMAVLQAMVTATQAPDESGQTEQLALDDAPRRASPALLLALEEPEVYQHPVRARHFARVLSGLASAQSQVVVATHSPYFVLPDQFAALRCFSISGGSAKVVSTTVSQIATEIGIAPDRVTRCMEKEIPRTFSEGFFAEAVVLTEGDTDRVVVEAVAECIGTPLDALGVTVLSMYGKESFHIPSAILRGLGVPAYLIADGDALAGHRKYPEDPTKAAEAEASQRAATERLLGWLPQDVAALQGSIPTSFGAPTAVTAAWTLFHDDLESELEAWPSFLAELASAGGALREKNVAAYRAAACSASLEDIPSVLRMLVEAIVAFVSS